MLPHSYEVPAAIVLVLGGALTCFAGYRLFRFVLAIYGFILGAMLASSTVGASNTWGMVVAALFGGLIGAIVVTFGYFVGIALAGAGLGALVAHVAWTQFASAEPPAALVITLSILGAIGAMVMQRYVVVIATAFGGAWTMLVGAITLLSGRDAVRAASSGDVWILYPLTPAPNQQWVPIAWVVLGAIGTAVQLGITARKG
jgi:uncharacterized protein DUF4203